MQVIPIGASCEGEVRVLDVQASKSADVLYLSLRGELNTLTAPDFEQRLNRLLEEGENRFVFGCGDLALVTSAGLRIFLALAKKMQKNGGAMALCEMADQVHEVFEISGFTQILSILPARADAEAMVRAAG
jgi:anti-anti-sigma factor